MAKISSHNDPSQKEMFRLLKIFGLASLALVLILSFFDGHRANNSGINPSFSIKDAGLLFFYNVRRIDYQTRRMPEANLEIYTHNSFSQDSTVNALLMNIIINKNNRTAFLYLKPQGNYHNQELLLMRNGNLLQPDSLTVLPGTLDRNTHLENAKIISQWLQQEADKVEILSDGKWMSLCEDKNERQAFLHTLNDFLKITGVQ